MSARFKFSKYPATVFIETGTYMGDGVQKALDEGFTEVWSIELQERLFRHSRERFKDNPNVHILFGNSIQCLPLVMTQIRSKAVFWLDSHIDLGNYVPGVTPEIDKCPLYSELEMIGKHALKNHTIMVDDMRIIGKEGWGLGVNREGIIERIKKINPNYQIASEDGEIPGDVLVAHAE